MNIHFSAAVLAASLVLPAGFVNADSMIETVEVSASRISTVDVEAPYATEIHRREDIEQSGASSLFDYLSRYTSLQVRPSYGNRFSPGIDMRGYGLGNGYQNIVMSVDGRRMNNIDMVPQLIGSIPLGDIERIEITKGSGSVIYGDGAMAGSIQIVTRRRTGASLGAYAGGDGERGASASVAHRSDRFDVSASLDHSKTDGVSDKDPAGHRDRSEGNTWNFAMSGRPAKALELSANASHTYYDNRYVGALTNAQFKKDPAQNGGANYTWQQLESDVWGLGASLEIAPEWTLSFRHWREDRESNYLSWSSISQYDIAGDEFSASFAGESFDLVLGLQANSGARQAASTGNETTKENFAYFAQAQKIFDGLTLSAGVRKERVEYTYDPASGASLNADHALVGWDLGANYRFSSEVTVFGNVNSAYQAPDVDRFFNFGGTFNGFIEPARVKTFTAGLNRITASHRLKFSVFHARLKNEIYYDGASFTNTNIDRSHKYGLELQEAWLLNARVTALLNYSWVRAKIDREDRGAGAYDGKELPGVPHHSLTAGADWKMTERSSLRVTHTWRSKTWAIGDFDNNNSQKQGAYNSTDLAYRYRLKDVKFADMEITAAASNLFEARNGVWVGDDAIYPVDFTRTWRLGVNASF